LSSGKWWALEVGPRIDAETSGSAAVAEDVRGVANSSWCRAESGQREEECPRYSLTRVEDAVEERAQALTVGSRDAMEGALGLEGPGGLGRMG